MLVVQVTITSRKQYVCWRQGSARIDGPQAITKSRVGNEAPRGGVVGVHWLRMDVVGVVVVRVVLEGVNQTAACT